MVTMVTSKCGCAQGACFCRFEDTDSVAVTGSGSKSDPFTATPQPIFITEDTDTLALVLDIAGDEATLEAQSLITGHVDVFTEDGVWNKPVGVTFVRVLMVGGGGGGASGESHTSSNNLGGGGGDAGQVTNFTLFDAEIPASVNISIGLGGAGGAAVANSDGNDGTDGGATLWGTWRAVEGGKAGRTLGRAGVHLAAGMPPGQFAVDYDEDWTEAHYFLAPGAGGTGEGEDWAARAGGFSHPGQGTRFPDDTGGGSAGGGDGRDELVTRMGGGGGGGSRGETGGNGGLYGGGGGGGGYDYPSSSPSGAGGNGADGIVVVISW